MLNLTTGSLQEGGAGRVAGEQPGRLEQTTHCPPGLIMCFSVPTSTFHLLYFTYSKLTMLV